MKTALPIRGEPSAEQLRVRIEAIEKEQRVHDRLFVTHASCAFRLDERMEKLEHELRATAAMFDEL